jgi:hypothetical protein
MQNNQYFLTLHLEITYSASLEPVLACPHNIFNTSIFSTAPQRVYGTERKGRLRGPYYEDLDLSLAKSFSMTERQRLEYRFEMFNVGSNWQSGAVIPDGNFGDSNFGCQMGEHQPLEAAYNSDELGIFVLVGGGFMWRWESA